MSALGQKQTLRAAKWHVRFTPKSRHPPCKKKCLLWANSGRLSAIGCSTGNKTFANFCDASVIAHRKIQSRQLLTWVNASSTCGVIIFVGRWYT